MNSLLADGETVLFIDRKDREYLRQLKSGKTFQLRGGLIDCDSVIGLPEGTKFEGGRGERFLVLRPTYDQLVPNLPRQAQVIYPKDVGPILVQGNIQNGSHVLEAGVGAGALSIALLRTIGPEGRLVTYELREDFVELGRANVERFFGEAPQWQLECRDIYEGIDERELDCIVLDLPEPWRTLDAAAEALHLGGVFVAYIPTVMQVKSLMDALEDHKDFGLVETSETLLRYWHNRDRSLRPRHRMVAHTGFLVVARRLASLREGA